MFYLIKKMVSQYILMPLAQIYNRAYINIHLIFAGNYGILPLFAANG